MDTQTNDSRGYRHPDAPWGGWQDTLVSTIRMEIDLGMIVRIVLPGAPKALLVEDAATSASMVVIADPNGHRYYIGSMAGVVLLAGPLEGRGDGLSRPQSRTPTMDVD